MQPALLKPLGIESLLGCVISGSAYHYSLDRAHCRTWNPNLLLLEKTIEKPLEFFYDISREYWRRIKLHYRLNYPATDKWSDGRLLQSTNRITVYQRPQFSLQLARKQLKDWNEVLDDESVALLEKKCQLAPDHDNAVWYDADGVKLVHYFPHLYTSEMLSPILDELDILLVKFPPLVPPEHEKRSSKFKEWRDHLGDEVPTGVVRLTYQHQVGHPHSPPGPSADFASRSGIRTTGAMNFRKSPAIRELSDHISVSASIDPKSWRDYRNAYIRMSDMFHLLKECNTDPLARSIKKVEHIHCFVGLYLLVNILTTIHRDVKDPPDGWVAMLVLGNFSRGNLCVPDLGLKLLYRAGDIVFMRSWALKHFITEYEGDGRYVILFSTTYSIFQWLDSHQCL